MQPFRKKIMFVRTNYYSQTEATKIFKLSTKQFKDLITKNDIATFRRAANLGEYTVNCIYVLKSDFDTLDLEKRLIKVIQS